MSISWGVKERFKFAPAGALRSCNLPMTAAVYAITYKQDPLNKPKAHTVLYFGHAEDLANQASEASRNVIEDWVGSGGDSSELFIFIHPMPGSTKWERSSVQEQLVSEYSPQCNRY